MSFALPTAPASRVNDAVLERRGITVDAPMRIVHYFARDVQRWMNLQTACENTVAEKRLAKKSTCRCSAVGGVTK